MAIVCLVDGERGGVRAHVHGGDGGGWWWKGEDIDLGSELFAADRGWSRRAETLIQTDT